MNIEIKKQVPTISGNERMIFKDAVNEKFPEGKAILRKYIKTAGLHEGRRIEVWFVQFPDLPGPVLRKILA